MNLTRGIELRKIANGMNDASGAEVTLNPKLIVYVTTLILHPNTPSFPSYW